VGSPTALPHRQEYFSCCNATKGRVAGFEYLKQQTKKKNEQAVAAARAASTLYPPPTSTSTVLDGDTGCIVPESTYPVGSTSNPSRQPFTKPVAKRTKRGRTTETHTTDAGTNSAPAKKAKVGGVGSRHTIGGAKRERPNIVNEPRAQPETEDECKLANWAIAAADVDGRSVDLMIKHATVLYNKEMLDSLHKTSSKALLRLRGPRLTSAALMKKHLVDTRRHAHLLELHTHIRSSADAPIDAAVGRTPIHTAQSQCLAEGMGAMPSMSDIAPPPQESAAQSLAASPQVGRTSLQQTRHDHNQLKLTEPLSVNYANIANLKAREILRVARKLNETLPPHERLPTDKAHKGLTQLLKGTVPAAWRRAGYSMDESVSF
jgi:hypothetical protein